MINPNLRTPPNYAVHLLRFGECLNQDQPAFCGRSATRSAHDNSHLIPDLVNRGLKHDTKRHDNYLASISLPHASNGTGMMGVAGSQGKGMPAKSVQNILRNRPIFPPTGHQVLGYPTFKKSGRFHDCLLYTSDAADDLLCVDLGGRRIIKKKKNSIVN